MRLIIAAALLTLGTKADAVPWPILSNPRIEQCVGTAGDPCTDVSRYGSDGTMLVDVNPVTPPNSIGGLTVRTIGVHCRFGNAMIGRLPFSQCSWGAVGTHSPAIVGKCELRGLDSWELTSDSTCATNTSWGPHRGAGPGGECVLFTNAAYVVGNAAVTTPWGMLTPEQAANSGNRFCSKPLPPSVTCVLELPSIIDHGVMRAGESSKREDFGRMECGGAPKIDVLVNGDRDTGGVRISATPFVVNPTSVRITSEINVSSTAEPGEHNATYVFVASPY